ncbi:MAG: class II aldolase/adducin family protein [Epsilonproteobacteria bacterium]|nr:class II aldolase/adducin family protein [Campylobacterota bacterium]
MKNLWDDNESEKYSNDLELRVYSSNLLGKSDDLVLHGGGNTSVKSVVNGEDILFVKGSGWDLVSIKQEGFAPVKLHALQEMATLKVLSDNDMVRLQKEAMINKSAPNPSVEAILHAIIPFKFVDHTHADAVVTLSNNINGTKLIKEIFPNFIIIPYVMPGFILAQKIYEITKDFDWEKCDGIILHNHGIFTFDDNPKKSYDKMVKAVSVAENFLEKNCKVVFDDIEQKDFDIDTLQKLLSDAKGFEVSYSLDNSSLAKNYSLLPQDKLTRGVLTPEHIIRTKREPLLLQSIDDIDDMKIAIESYKKDYISYFDYFSTNEIMLSPTPNYAVVKNFGVVCFGKDEKEANIIKDIVSHTMSAVLQADLLGGYQSISLQDSFMMEYWELEQAKLKK